jgi:hypothetical protein
VRARDERNSEKAGIIFLKHITTSGAIAATACLWSTTAAASPPAPLDTPERINVLVTYGEDACPEAQGDEIVVCAQRPESERYRIPKEVREVEAEEQAGEQSWSSALAAHEEAARPGRPGSCSVVGTYGSTGCQAAIMRQWFDERRLTQ